MVIVDEESCQKSQLYNYANANTMVKFSFGYFSQDPKTRWLGT